MIKKGLPVRAVPYKIKKAPRREAWGLIIN